MPRTSRTLPVAVSVRTSNARRSVLISPSGNPADGGRPGGTAGEPGRATRLASGREAGAADRHLAQLGGLVLHGGHLPSGSAEQTPLLGRETHIHAKAIRAGSTVRTGPAPGNVRNNPSSPPGWDGPDRLRPTWAGWR